MFPGAIVTLHGGGGGGGGSDEMAASDCITEMGNAHQAHILFDQDTLHIRFAYPDGHCLPGGQAIFSCLTDLGFEAGQVMLNFSIAHPKP